MARARKPTPTLEPGTLGNALCLIGLLHDRTVSSCRRRHHKDTAAQVKNLRAIAEQYAQRWFDLHSGTGVEVVLLTAEQMNGTREEV